MNDNKLTSRYRPSANEAVEKNACVQFVREFSDIKEHYDR